MNQKLLLAVFFVGLTIGSFANTKPRVFFAGFFNETSDSTNEMLASSAGDSLLLTLRQLNAYDIVSNPESAVQEVRNPADICRKKNLDYLLFGRIGVSQNGDLSMNLKVFNARENAVAFDRRTEIASIMDSFSEVDDLVTAALENVTGSHIAYGYISATVDGKGSYQLKIDDLEFGSIGANPIRTMAGSHNLVVYRKTNGSNTLLLSRKFNIPESQTVNVYVIDTESPTLNPVAASSTSVPEQSAVVKDSAVAGSAGLGISIEPIPEGCFITCVLAGSPAERAGVKPGEVIAQVDGKDIAGFTAEKIESMIFGDSGTSVRLKLKQYKFFFPGPRTVSVIREKLAAPDLVIDEGAGITSVVHLKTVQFFEKDAAGKEVYGYSFKTNGSADYIYTKFFFEGASADHERTFVSDIKISFGAGKVSYNKMQTGIRPGETHFQNEVRCKDSGMIYIDLSYAEKKVASCAYYYSVNSVSSARQ